MDILLIHQDPPVPCLYGFDVGLRELGHTVHRIGPRVDKPWGEDFYALEPDYKNMLVTVPDPYLPRFVEDSNADLVLWLQPSHPTLASGLLNCPVPTVAMLTEDYKFSHAYQIARPLFDACPTAIVQRAFDPRPVEWAPLFNFIGLQWLQPADIGQPRVRDLAFVGYTNVHGVTEARDAELNRVHFACADRSLSFDHTNGIYLRDQLDFYAASRCVWQYPGQGHEDNLTYRAGEAMASGAVCIAKRPQHLGGLPEPWVEGEHILYYDTPEECADIVEQMRTDIERWATIAVNALEWIERNPPAAQMERFLRDIVEPIRQAGVNKWRRHKTSIDEDSAARAYLAALGARP